MKVDSGNKKYQYRTKLRMNDRIRYADIDYHIGIDNKIELLKALPNLKSKIDFLPNPHQFIHLEGEFSANRIFLTKVTLTVSHIYWKSYYSDDEFRIPELFGVTGKWETKEHNSPVVYNYTDNPIEVPFTGTLTLWEVDPNSDVKKGKVNGNLFSVVLIENGLISDDYLERLTA